MAYLDLAQPASVAMGERQDRSIGSSRFSGLEWSVIALAQRDRLGSLGEPSRIAKALGTLFGTWKSARLADGRLEALRRMAVLAWHKGYVVPLSEIQAFKAAGFTIDDYEALQASIARGRTRSGRRPA